MPGMTLASDTLKFCGFLGVLVSVCHVWTMLVKAKRISSEWLAARLELLEG